MKKKLLIKALLLGSVGLWLSASSCQQGDMMDVDVDLQPTEEITLTECKILSESDAAKVAGIFCSDRFGMPVVPSRSSQDVEAICNAVGDPLAYVVNNPGGGWAIVSATTDYHPILAYSDDAASSFSLEAAQKVDGLRAWIEDISSDIESSDCSDSVMSAQITSEWLDYSIQPRGAVTPTPPVDFTTAQGRACLERIKQLNDQYASQGWRFYSLSLVRQTTIPSSVYSSADYYGSPYEYTIVGLKDLTNHVEVGPLVNMKWHQENNFNALCPNKYPAGCVAVAMGQIMYFHKYPAKYDWSSMEVRAAKPASQALIADIGKAVNMVYGPEESWTTIDNAVKGFVSFGYSAVKKDHNNDDVYNEIVTNKRPVYMQGRATEGHAWVCEGVRRTYYGYNYCVEYINNSNVYSNHGETSIYNPGTCGSSQSPITTYLNWGDGGSDNGWYINPTKGSDNYSSDRKNIYVHL